MSATVILVAGPGPASDRDSADEDRAGVGAPKVGEISLGDEKGQRIRPGAIERSQSLELHPPIAEQAATDQLGDRLRGEAMGGHRSRAWP